MSEGEIWKECAGFPTYEITPSGKIRRRIIVRGKAPQILKPWKHPCGYPMVSLRHDGRSHHVLVHRIVGLTFIDPTAEEFDHKNHQIENPSQTQLRAATRAQNARNNRGKSNHSSQYKGVSWIAAKRHWYACIAINGKTQSLGCYRDEWSAAKAYNKAAFAAWGEFAFINKKGQGQSEGALDQAAA